MGTLQTELVKTGLANKVPSSSSFTKHNTYIEPLKTQENFKNDQSKFKNCIRKPIKEKMPTLTEPNGEVITMYSLPTDAPPIDVKDHLIFRNPQRLNFVKTIIENLKSLPGITTLDLIKLMKHIPNGSKANNHTIITEFLTILNNYSQNIIVRKRPGLWKIESSLTADQIITIFEQGKSTKTRNIYEQVKAKKLIKNTVNSSETPPEDLLGVKTSSEDLSETSNVKFSLSELLEIIKTHKVSVNIEISLKS